MLSHTPVPCTGMPSTAAPCTGMPSTSSFLWCTLRETAEIVPVFVSLPPTWEPEISTRLLALTWPLWSFSEWIHGCLCHLKRKLKRYRISTELPKSVLLSYWYPSFLFFYKLTRPSIILCRVTCGSLAQYIFRIDFSPVSFYLVECCG